MSAKVFTPLAYLKNVTPGGLVVVTSGSDTFAYIVDRGWPADPGEQPPESPLTRGGKLVKVKLAGEDSAVVETGGWPSTAISALLDGAKPFHGPFVPPAGSPLIVCGAVTAELAPGEPDPGGTVSPGKLYRINGTGGLDASIQHAQLRGPFAVAFDQAASLFVTNARANPANNEPQIVRIGPGLAANTIQAVTFAPSIAAALRPRAAGGIAWRQETVNSVQQNVVYVTDLADDPAVARGADQPAAADRGRLLRLVLNAAGDTVTAASLYADGLDRPIGVQFNADTAYVLCAWPGHRAEIGIDEPAQPPGTRCLPPYRTWRHPFGSIQRIPRPSDPTQKGATEAFAPALVGAAGMAIDGGKLYVATAAGPPTIPVSWSDTNIAQLCPSNLNLKGPWRKPRSGMLYVVEL